MKKIARRSLLMTLCLILSILSVACGQSAGQTVQATSTHLTTATPITPTPTPSSGGWKVTIHKVHKETQLISVVPNQVFMAKNGFIYLVIDATFQNLDTSGSVTVSANDIKLLSENGSISTPDLVGSNTTPGSTFSYYTFGMATNNIGNALELSLAFGVKVATIDQSFKLQFQMLPPLPVSVK